MIVRGRAFGLTASLFAAAACGYAPVYGPQASAGLHVRMVRAPIADPAAVDEVASGVREGLALAGELAPGDGYPRVEIEVVHADAISEGVQAVSGAPLARGIDVGVVGRAWIVMAPGARPRRDTGDLRADAVIAVDETSRGALDPRAAVFHAADARRAAGRRLGRKLAERLMGQPASSEAPYDLP